MIHMIRGSSEVPGLACTPCGGRSWVKLNILDPGPQPHPTPPTALLSRIRGLIQSPPSASRKSLQERSGQAHHGYIRTVTICYSLVTLQGLN